MGGSSIRLSLALQEAPWGPPHPQLSPSGWGEALSVVYIISSLSWGLALP